VWATIAAISRLKLAVWSARADDTSGALISSPSAPKIGASMQLMAVLRAWKCSSRWMIMRRNSVMQVPMPFVPSEVSDQPEPGARPQLSKAETSPFAARSSSTTPWQSVRRTPQPELPTS
jgi:hypothetical protein